MFVRAYKPTNKNFRIFINQQIKQVCSTGAGKTNEEMESTINLVIDKALVTEQVIDVFDAAGIKKPEISILSEEFLMEVKNMEHKNVNKVKN